jgi:hypothetical protein
MLNIINSKAVPSCTQSAKKSVAMKDSLGTSLQQTLFSVGAVHNFNMEAIFKARVNQWKLFRKIFIRSFNLGSSWNKNSTTEPAVP